MHTYITFYLCSLLVAIGIEAFNRFSQLKSEEKSKNKDEVVRSCKPSRQEDEVSATSGFSSTQNVCKFIQF